MPKPKTPRCGHCRNYDQWHCAHFDTRTDPTYHCTHCPAFQRGRGPTRTKTPPGLCATCRHYPGAADMLCREANRHASARSCKHYALPVNVVPLIEPPKRTRRRWSRQLPK